MSFTNILPYRTTLNALTVQAFLRKTRLSFSIDQISLPFFVKSRF